MGARERRDETPEKRSEREAKLAEAVKTILTCIGEDPEREGLLKTPDRYAKALMFFTQGYERNIHGNDRESILISVCMTNPIFVDRRCK